MKKSYQFFIDVFLTEDINEIPIVVSGIAEAEDSAAARDTAYAMMMDGQIEEVPEGYTDFYVWEIFEDDLIEEDVE